MLTTGIQVADGTMQWEQAALSVGTGAFTAGTGVGADYLGGLTGGGFMGAVVENTTRTLGSTLVSGVTYDPQNGFGWDGDGMTSRNTWLAAGVTAAAGSIASGVKMSGLSSSLVNGVGSSVSQGITTGDWENSFKYGMTSAVSEYAGGLISRGFMEGLGSDNAYTKELVNNYATYGIGLMLGSKERFDMNQIGQVDTINLVVQDMYAKYEKSRASAESGEPSEMGKKQLPVNKVPDDPFELLDNALAGIFTSMGRGLGQTMADIGGAIRDSASAAWGGVASFTEKAGNWLGGDGFVDNEKRNQNLMAEYRDLYNNPVLIAQNGSGDRMSDTGDDNRATRDAIRMTEDREHRMQEIEAKLGVSNQELSARIEAENAAMIPDAAQLNKEIAGTWKNSTAKEVNAKLNALRKIDPEAAKKWDAYFKGVREAEAKYAARQRDKKDAKNGDGRQNSGYLSYELDYNTSGPNWGGDFSFSSLFSSGDNKSQSLDVNNSEKYRILQNGIGTGYDDVTCGFISAFGMGWFMSGHTEKPSDEVVLENYKKAEKAGYVDKGYVNYYDKIINMNGNLVQNLDDKDFAIRTGSGNDAELNSRMMASLDQGVFVIAHMNIGQEGKHKEWIRSYEKQNDRVFYKLVDSSTNNDAYVDSKNWNVYRKVDGKMVRSRTSNKKPYRVVNGVTIFQGY